MLTSTLKSLGLQLDSVQAPVMLPLLKAIVESKRDYETPLASSEVWRLLGRFEPGKKLPKAASKKALRTLVEVGLVEAKASGTRRKGYFASASTVENGLRKFAKRVKSEIIQEISLVDSERKAVSNIDCGVLAQGLVEELTGHRHRISSRLITGAEDITRAVGYNMGDVAHKGDVIRVTVVSPSPFLDEQEELIDEIARAAHNGAEVRCLVQARLEKALFNAAALRHSAKRAGGPKSREEQEYGMEVMAYDGPNPYHAATYGNQCMALVVSEDPVTVTWITRDFNPDIIDQSISVFDDLWQNARSMTEPGVRRGLRTDVTVAEPERQEQPTTRTTAATREAQRGQTESEQLTKALELIGFDANEERFSVLRIALKKHHNQGMPIDFAGIYEQLRTENGRKGIRRPEVYRCLSSLETDGYIQCDRTSHPFHYTAAPETLLAAFGEAQSEALRGLELKRSELNSEIVRLTGLNLIQLTTGTTEKATGVPSSASASFADGYDQMQELTTSEVYSAVRGGDTLRVSMGWSRLTPSVTRTRIDALAEVIRRGAKTKVLLSEHWADDDSTVGLLTNIYKSLLQENWDVSVRIRRTKDSTYQFAARNNEGIMLIVSEEPPAATYIPRSVNELLVDDAIASFDTEFDEADNLLSLSSERARR